METEANAWVMGNVTYFFLHKGVLCMLTEFLTELNYKY